jgi:uncharacterized protein DUF3592
MLSGVGLSVVAARHFIRRLAFIRKSAVADGVVVALREERDGTDNQRACFPRIRFRAASGREVTFEAGMARGADGWHVGEVVAVRYWVERPETAELDGFVALWGPTVVFALLAVVFVGVGISLWFERIPGL